MSKVKTYVKLPIPVKAIKFTGEEENIQFILNWSLTQSTCSIYTPITRDAKGIGIHTLEGIM